MAFGESAKRQAPTHGDSGPFLLLADDDTAVREVTAKILERAGYRLLKACDGQEAVELFRAHQDRIVAVLLDAVMPRKGGDDVFRELQQIRPNIPVIITTGDAHEDVRARFLGMGVVGFVEKPYEMRHLVSEVARAVGPAA